MSFISKNSVFIGEIAEFLKRDFKGNPESSISKVGVLDDNLADSLKFSNDVKDFSIQGVVIGSAELSCENIIISDSPRLDFCKAVAYLLDCGKFEFVYPRTSISSSAVVSDTAVIESGVVIGDNTFVGHNVVIHSGTVIGSNTIIRDNTVIGAEGFGFEKDIDGSWIRFTHLGGVQIGDNVEIGALNSVCKGSIGNTVISNGTKTDNLVHIAHNCFIGKDCIITAAAELSGGVTLGNNVWIGPNSSLMQKITVGDSAIVGLGSVVTKSVESCHTVAGVPAKIIRRG